MLFTINSNIFWYLPQSSQKLESIKSIMVKHKTKTNKEKSNDIKLDVTGRSKSMKNREKSTEKEKMMAKKPSKANRIAKKSRPCISKVSTSSMKKPSIMAIKPSKITSRINKRKEPNSTNRRNSSKFRSKTKMLAPKSTKRMKLIENGESLSMKSYQQRGTNEEVLLSESGNSGKLLSSAIMKHIHPTCNSDSDASNFSSERDKKSGTEVNHVFKVDPEEFMEVDINGEMVFMSKVKCPYWECQKKQNGKFEVTEKGVMHAVFRKSDGHLLIERCRETRQ